MDLKIITLIKQVPDTHNVVGEAMKADGTINRAALPTITNPEDLNALEAALKIKETVGATITAVTLGPASAVKVLKECLYRGVDDVVLISDPKFAASDTLATSYALQCAIQKLGVFDLIICGRQAIDGDTAQVGPQIAEKLGINQLTGVSEIIAVTQNNILVKRIHDNGYEILLSKLPVLITVIAEANEPRSYCAKRVMLYKNVVCDRNANYSETYLNPGNHPLCTHIKHWDAKDINAEPKRCGLIGSPTKVKQVTNVVLTARETKQITNSTDAISKLMHELIAEHILG